MKKTKRKFLIKIQSVSDIITNSSSEIYQIKSDITETMFREIWDSVLRDWGYPEEEINGDETIYGIIIRKDSDYIILDYSVMCNLNHDAFDKLRDIFGTENVKDITWEDW
jgi:hypothetical protein